MKERAAFINVSQENKLSIAYDAPTRERLSAALDFLPGVLLEEELPARKEELREVAYLFHLGHARPGEGADSGVFPRP